MEIKDLESKDFKLDLLGFNEQADDRALAGRKDDEGITPTKNYIYDLAIDKLGATPYQAQTVAMLAEATPIAAEYLGIEETTNLVVKVLNNALSEDMLNMVLLFFSESHDLQLNPAGVRQILVGTD